MRTTLTLDDDVAVQIEELRVRERRTLKDVVNDALRRGLTELSCEERSVRKPFETKTFDSVPLVPSFDNIAEVLAYAEGEDFK